MKANMRKAASVFSKNSPTLLTAMGVAGLVTTVILAVRATPKAMELIEEREREMHNEQFRWIGPKDEVLTKTEIVKTAYKVYLPTIGMGLVSVACIIGANSVSLRRNAAIASAYSLSEVAFKEYQNKIVETIGDKKEREIRKEVREKKVAGDTIEPSNVIVGNFGGEQICYESLTGRYFKSDAETIRGVINKLNKNLLSDDFVPVNDLYYELGLSSVKMGDDIGWHVNDGLVDISFSGALDAKGVPCLVLDYSVEPRYTLPE